MQRGQRGADGVGRERHEQQAAAALATTEHPARLGALRKDLLLEAAELQARLDAEGEAFAADVARLEGEIDAQAEALDTVQVRARSSDIDIRFVALLWSPYRRAADGRTRPA